MQPNEKTIWVNFASSSFGCSVVMPRIQIRQEAIPFKRLGVKTEKCALWLTLMDRTSI